MAPGEPLARPLSCRVHRTLEKATDVVEQRAGFLIMQSRQAPARRPVEKGASWGCLADALISIPSSGFLEKKATSK